jgi:APA family basic amino acid/polyamine antiporter
LSNTVDASNSGVGKKQNISTKQIGIWVCSSLVIGNMIGSGIFLLPASLGAYGPISLVGWLITGIGSIVLALVFARLTLHSTRSGGPFAYAQQGFGDLAGFLVAWGHWIAAWTGNAALAVAFISYLTVFLPVLKTDVLLSGATTMGVVWGLFFVNLLGVKAVGIVQIVTTVLKILPLIAFATVGFIYFEPANFTEFNTSEEGNISAIFATSALTLWAFLGLESATVPADNVDNPKKTIPRATIFGTAFVAILYLLVSISIYGIMTPAELSASNAPFADAAGRVWGSWGFYFVALGAVISCLGSLNGWLLIQAQVPMAAAKAGLFPKIFGKLDAKGRPVAGMLISTILLSILIMSNFSGDLVGLFTFIILLATLSSLIPYLFCSLASIMISVVEKKTDQINWPTQIFITVFSFVYVIGAIIGAGQVVVYWGTILLLASVPVYVLARWQHRKE